MLCSLCSICYILYFIMWLDNVLCFMFSSYVILLEDQGLPEDFMEPKRKKKMYPLEVSSVYEHQT